MTRRLPLRLVVTIGVLTTTVALGVLVSRGLGSGVVYYRTPSEVAAGTGGGERVIRVGGTVARGSVRWDEASGVLHFVLADDRGRVPVRVAGAPPRLFAPGRDALVEGRLSGGVLRSSDVIVKHDETYRAPAEGGPR